MQSDPLSSHVLALDDEEDMLAVYAELLADEGFRVTARRTPSVDPAAVAALAPDLVVLDLLAGRLEGVAGLLAALKADPATRGIPVLVCSGDTRRLAELEEQLGAWGCGVVEKPFDIDDFAAAVRLCLGGRPRGARAALEPAAA